MAGAKSKEFRSENPTNYVTSTDEFKSRKSRRDSSKYSKGHGCEYCEKRFQDQKTLLRHIRTHAGEKSYICNHCQKSFSWGTGLKIHMRTHTGERPYACEYCQKSFSTKSTLMDHIRTHTSEKPYKCELCNKSFCRGSTLNEHSRTHTDKKPYKCVKCHKALSSRSSLINHARTHTGEKLYKCEYCQIAFATWSDLKSHINTHTGERPFKCRFCGYCAAQSNTLIQHERVHTAEKPYKCQLCGFSSRRKYALKMHQQVHATSRDFSNHTLYSNEEHKGEKYECPHCPKAYFLQNSLRHHIKKHVVKQQYQCSVCNYSAIVKSAVNAHERRVHKEAEKKPAKRRAPSSNDNLAFRAVVVETAGFHGKTALKTNEGRLLETYSKICKVCKFSASADAELALHTTLMHRLPRVTLQRLKLVTSTV